MLDVVPGKATVSDYMRGEARFSAGENVDGAHYLALCAHAERGVARRIELYSQLARVKLSRGA